MEKTAAQNWFSIAGVSLLFLGLFGLYQYSNPRPPTALPLISPSPDAEVQLPSLAAIKPDQVVYINHWAEWCEPCLVEIPELLRMAETHLSDHWTLVLAHRDPMNDQARNLMRQWQSQNNPPNVIWISESELSADERPPVLPFHQIFNRSGRLVHESYGAIKERLPGLALLVQQLVSENPPSK